MVLPVEEEEDTEAPVEGEAMAQVDGAAAREEEEDTGEGNPRHLRDGRELM